MLERSLVQATRICHVYVRISRCIKRRRSLSRVRIVQIIFIPNKHYYWAKFTQKIDQSPLVVRYRALKSGMNLFGARVEACRGNVTATVTTTYEYAASRACMRCTSSLSMADQCKNVRYPVNWEFSSNPCLSRTSTMSPAGMAEVNESSNRYFSPCVNEPNSGYILTLRYSQDGTAA